MNQEETQKTVCFRPLRRNRQALEREACEKILKDNSAGVLAVMGDCGYPYAVPLSYVYTGGKIYFHSAVRGHKIDALARCDKVSFCVIGQDRLLPEKFTTVFSSVIVFGRARVIEDAHEKRAALEALADKYALFQRQDVREAEIEKSFARVAVIELSPEHISGKQAIESVTDL